MRNYLRGRRWPLAILLVIFMVALAAGRLLLGDLPAPTVGGLQAARPSTLILASDGQLLYEVIADESKQTPLTFAQIPPVCWRATVAVEDSRFFQHPGFDPAAIARAAWQNRQQSAIVSGASTITQQLARTTLMTSEERHEPSLRRKLREAWLAFRIELLLSKEEVLAAYLNQVYYGNFANGLEAAAQSYFGKSARALDLAECSMLAGLIQNPAMHSPLHNLEGAQARQGLVLDLMVENNNITPEQADLARAEQLHFAASPFSIEAPHFVSLVEQQLERLVGVEAVQSGGLRVTTTLDLDWQRQAEAIVQRRLAQLADEPDAPLDRRVDNAALIALDPNTGAILTLVGSPDYFDAVISGAVNGAVSLRQPGSAIKPLTYAVALDPAQSQAAGRTPLTAASVIADVRTSFLTAEGEPYVPQNYDMAWHGPVSVRTALASSYNLPAVKVLDNIGVGALVEQARRQGISTFRPGQRYGLALTLGGGEVSLLELTGAYAAFVNGGERIEPYAINRVENLDGEVLFDAASRLQHAPRVQAVDPTVAWLITDILSDDDARAPSFGRNSVLRLSRPAAAKTGTTTDWRDNWTVGYTPDLVAGVWVGNADNTPMFGVSGVTGAGPIWHDFMETALRQMPARNFTSPSGLTSAEICVDSGLLPTEWCSRRRSELFIHGTEPTTFDEVYQPVVVDACNDIIARSDTPE